MSVRSATLKRLIKERQLMDASPCREFTAEMLEDNALEWHFTMLGPADTPYANGYYHGKILVPADYPFKPPDVVLLTPNGRFELDKRICLSISSYHPENWHPTWGIATVLHALRDFMATPGNRAIGAIEYPKVVREDLALKSVTFHCPVCGCHVEAVRERMMAAPPAADSTKKEMVPATPIGGPASPPGALAPALGGDSPLQEQQREPSMESMTLPAAATPPQGDTPSLTAATEDASPVEAQQEAPAAATSSTDGAAAEEAAPEVPAPQPATPALPPAARPPPPRVFEQRDGEVILNLSIHTVDSAIRTVLILIAVILAKKALFDYGSTITRHLFALMM